MTINPRYNYQSLEKALSDGYWKFIEDTKTNKRPKEICEIDDELKAIYHSHDTV